MISTIDAGLAAFNRANETLEGVAQRSAQPTANRTSTVRDAVHLIEAKTMAQAGGALIRTGDQMLGTLVDIFI
jgi:hypothetical protein